MDMITPLLTVAALAVTLVAIAMIGRESAK